MPRVNPEILAWARKTAGLTPEDAVSKLTLNDARGVPAVDRLAALEDGTDEPTRVMLVKMAKKYRRPLLTFYLAAPPARGDRGEDFRTLPEAISPGSDALVDALIRDVRARQKMVQAIIENEDEFEPLQFVGSVDVDAGHTNVKAAIIDLLDLDINYFRGLNGPERAFSYLRELVEENGVFVLLIGNLGSYHSAIDLEVFRGFALADEYAPFIIINDADSKSAWSFTLLHEFTHLMLGQTGISGVNVERRIEKFCNDVAGEILLPSSELTQIDFEPGTDFENLKSIISDFARTRNVSSTMVAYNLLKNRRIGYGLWEQLRTSFRQDFLNSRNEQRVRGRETSGGPDYYVLRRQRIGNALIGFVERNLAGGEISTTKAGKVLGIKAKNVENLIRRSSSAPVVLG